jgi:transposase InsO family protein
LLDFSRPGKPTDNPFIESFNGSFRDECLNTNWFLSGIPNKKWTKFYFKTDSKTMSSNSLVMNTEGSEAGMIDTNNSIKQ